MVNPMDAKQLRKFYGRRCHAVIRCQPCGRAHSISGTIAPGRLDGDFTLDGYTYQLPDVVSLVPDMPIVPGRPVWSSALPLLWVTWFVLVELKMFAGR